MKDNKYVANPKQPKGERYVANPQSKGKETAAAAIAKVKNVNNNPLAHGGSGPKDKLREERSESMKDKMDKGPKRDPYE